MVGLSNMESKRERCGFCGNKQSVTDCDKTHKPVCVSCSTVIPVSENISKTLIQVVAMRHAPKRHTDKLEELARSRGEKIDL